MFKEFASYDFILKCYLSAYKGRRKSSEVIGYKLNLEDNLIEFRRLILNLEYKHSNYRTFVISDSKKRIINAPVFSDHILHHMIYDY